MSLPTQSPYLVEKTARHALKQGDLGHSRRYRMGGLKPPLYCNSPMARIVHTFSEATRRR